MSMKKILIPAALLFIACTLFAGETPSPLSGTYRSSAGMSGKAELIFLKDMFFYVDNNCTLRGNYYVGKDTITFTLKGFHHVSLHLYNMEETFDIKKQESYVKIDNYSISCKMKYSNGTLEPGPRFFWIEHLMNSASTCSRMNEKGMQAIIGVQKVISKDRDLTEWYRFTSLQK